MGDPAIRVEELALVSTDADSTLAAVDRALRMRESDAEDPYAASRLAEAFSGRLSGCGALFEVPGLTPNLLALCVRALHESFLSLVSPPKKRGRGRPPEPTSKIEDDLLIILSALRMIEARKCEWVAQIAGTFIGVELDGVAVRRRGSARVARHKKAVQKWIERGADPREYPVGYGYDLPSNSPLARKRSAGKRHRD